MIDLKSIPISSGVYLLRCIKNNKTYVGKAINLYQRIIRHKNSEHYLKLKNPTSIIRAIKKHGWSSFEIEILHVFEQQPDNLTLLALEAAFIEHFNSTNRSVGYNLLKVSSDWTGYSHSDSTKQKLSKAAKTRYQNGFVNPRKGISLSQSTIQKRLETIQQNQSYAGKNNPRFRSTIFNFKKMDTGETFAGTQYDFYTKYGLSSSNVSSLIHGRLAHHKKWKLLPCAHV
jgi:group I intron endonuclease